MNLHPTTQRARLLRKTPNAAEQHLWNALKSKQLAGYKFTRQYPVGPYFADFACRRHFLLIEIDGSQHNESAHDQQRDAYLLDEGYSVLRFPVGSVLNGRSAVCDSILAALEGRMEPVTDAPDIRFARSSVLPMKFRRHRPWMGM